MARLRQPDAARSEPAPCPLCPCGAGADGQARGRGRFSISGRQVLVRTAPLASAGPTSVVVVFNDMTDLRRLEAVRRDLVANVSHELRTPLDGDPRLRRDAQGRGPRRPRPRRRIRRHHLPPRRTPLPAARRSPRAVPPRGWGAARCARTSSGLGPIVSRALDSVRPRPARGRWRSRWKCWRSPSSLGDAEALEQILVNLLDNAVKYTPKGGRVVLRAERTKPDRWRIEVEDSGIGIEPSAPRSGLRAVLPGRCRSLARDGGHGAGPRHREAPEPGHGRARRREQRARPGLHLLGGAAGGQQLHGLGERLNAAPSDRCSAS